MEPPQNSRHFGCLVLLAAPFVLPVALALLFALWSLMFAAWNLMTAQL